MDDTVLFIGAGRMGGPMAERLLDAGIGLSVADLSDDALAPFKARGVPVGHRGAELPGAVVITMLPTDRQVEDALFGPEGACRGLPRSAVIDMSSASPGSTARLSGQLAALGIPMLDAPVSGGMASARKGTLTAMVGGDPAVFERFAPLLQPMCGAVTRVGPVGSGHVVKALNNFLSAATLWTATEALIIGMRLGVDPETMLKVWTAGSGRSHATEVKLPQHVLTGRFDFGQTLELFCKDIAIAASLAEEAGVDARGLDALQLLWTSARDSLGGSNDITRIAEIIDER
ncbi:NAD(P)-dependent oxidoreductase [Chthonobacter albigriseus]|uniref:NAD(P)-dependent oxidoreductase n=1 Tax=Chthonobacter albigriseus TaxID=1683161 RepID=UPI0015EF39DB|nr:NAD(P)-dependent oxidoreductase [Chthonobacter albigriseus]